jgi:hypothetical protein
VRVGTLQGCRAVQGRYLATLTSPPSAGYIAAVVALNLFGYLIFRSSNLQKVQSPAGPALRRKRAAFDGRTYLRVCSHRFRSDDGVATPCDVLQHRATCCNPVPTCCRNTRVCQDLFRRDPSGPEVAHLLSIKTQRGTRLLERTLAPFASVASDSSEA